MRKAEAISLFDSVSGLARGLGVTTQAISQWPEKLEQRKIDWVVGAAVRLGKLDLVSYRRLQQRRRAG